MMPCVRRAAALGMVFDTGGTRSGASTRAAATLDALVTITADMISDQEAYPRPRGSEEYKLISSGSKLVAEKGDVVLVVESINRTDACKARPDNIVDGVTITARCQCYPGRASDPNPRSATGDNGRAG